MYQRSANVTFDNGAGYIPGFDIDNIVCNTDKYITYRTWVETNTSLVDTRVREEYFNISRIRQPL